MEILFILLLREKFLRVIAFIQTDVVIVIIVERININ